MPKPTRSSKKTTPEMFKPQHDLYLQKILSFSYTNIKSISNTLFPQSNIPLKSSYSSCRALAISYFSSSDEPDSSIMIKSLSMKFMDFLLLSQEESLFLVLTYSSSISLMFVNLLFRVSN